MYLIIGLAYKVYVYKQCNISLVIIAYIHISRQAGSEWGGEVINSYLTVVSAVLQPQRLGLRLLDHRCHCQLQPIPTVQCSRI